MQIRSCTRIALIAAVAMGLYATGSSAVTAAGAEVQAPICNSTSLAVAPGGTVEVPIDCRLSAEGEQQGYGIARELDSPTTVANGRFTPDVDPANAPAKMAFEANADAVGESSLTFSGRLIGPAPVHERLAAGFPATAAIRIDPTGQLAPVCDDLSAEVENGDTIEIPLSCAGPTSAVVAVRTDSVTAHGSLSLSGRTATYKANHAYGGIDTFTYYSQIGGTRSNIATVRIKVKVPPEPAGRPKMRAQLACNDTITRTTSYADWIYPFKTAESFKRLPPGAYGRGGGPLTFGAAQRRLAALPSVPGELRPDSIFSKVHSQFKFSCSGNVAPEFEVLSQPQLGQLGITDNGRSDYSFDLARAATTAGDQKPTYFDDEAQPSDLPSGAAKLIHPYGIKDTVRYAGLSGGRPLGAAEAELRIYLTPFCAIYRVAGNDLMLCSQKSQAGSALAGTGDPASPLFPFQFGKPAPSDCPRVRRWAGAAATTWTKSVSGELRVVISSSNFSQGQPRSFQIWIEHRPSGSGGASRLIPSSSSFKLRIDGQELVPSSSRGKRAKHTLAIPAHLFKAGGHTVSLAVGQQTVRQRFAVQRCARTDLASR